MKFEVKNRFTGDAQFTADIGCDEDTSYAAKVGLAVRWAIANKADLTGANLYGANLSRVNLSRADLYGANLTGANLDEEKDIFLQGDNPVLMLNPIGSEGGTLIAYKTNKGTYLCRGCFVGTMETFLATVQKKHGDSRHGSVYRAACQFIEAWALCDRKYR